MDGELLFWMLFFVGGYGLVIAVLLRAVFRSGSGTGPEAPRSEEAGGSS